MDENQSTVARLALGAAAKYGFVIAGGNAISLHGIGSRPSEDVDLFTNDTSAELFREAVSAVERVLRDAAWMTETKFAVGTYARINAVRAEQAVVIDFGVDYRSHPPTVMSVGPVLSLEDAAASKMATLYSRGLPRDYLDVAALIGSGRFARAQLLALGDDIEASPMDRRMLADRFRSIDNVKDQEFAAYGVTLESIEDTRLLFREWAAAVAADVSSPDVSP